MNQIAPDSVKQSLNYYASKLEFLSNSIRTFPTPQKDLEFDDAVFETLNSIVHSKVPEVVKSSTSERKFVVTFKTRYQTDLWTMVDELIEEHIERDIAAILAEKDNDLFIIEKTFVGFAKDLRSIDYYLNPISEKVRTIEGRYDFKCFEEYGSVKFANVLHQTGKSSFTSDMKMIISNTLKDVHGNPVTLIKTFMKYDIPIDGIYTSTLFEDAAMEVIDSFCFENNHFANVLKLQKNIGYYCENHFSTCQRLTMSSIYRLILDFDSLSRYLNHNNSAPSDVICMFVELRKIISMYYPWRMDELIMFTTYNISYLLGEDKLTIFVLKYSGWIQDGRQDLVDESRKSIIDAINADAKLLDKIAKWICKVSEDELEEPLLFPSTCTFLNSIFPQTSKHDEILWSLYRKKYFLRSLLKSTMTDNGSLAICNGKRFDQRLLESGSLHSVHCSDIRELNNEFQNSLLLRRIGGITPVILKQTSVVDFVDPSDISGLILPVKFEQLLKEQWNIFSEKGENERKTLNLQPELNIIELKSNFKISPSDDFLILHVNLVQACILSLFDNNRFLSLSEIQSLLMKDGEEVLMIEKNIQMFTEIGMLKLNKEVQYSINKKYKPKSSALQGGRLILYHLPRITTKRNEDDKSDDSWYQDLIKACIVRILKSRKKCTRTKLFELTKLEYPSLTFGEFKEALKNHSDYYKLQDGNYIYIT